MKKVCSHNTNYWWLFLYIFVPFWNIGPKNTLVSGNADNEKNFHPRGRKFIVADFLEIFTFIVFLFFYFFCLFVGFLKSKIYILIHIRLFGRVSDKKNSHGRFLETRLLIFWPSVFHLFRSQVTGNCLLFTSSTAMWEVNRCADDLRVLTAIELYLNCGFGSNYSSFI